jgi:hypothetical protein
MIEPNTATHDPIDKAVGITRRWWPGHTEAAVVCLETCLSMLEAVDANANPTNLLEYWFDELGTIARSGRAVAR